MKKEHACVECGRPLVADEVALARKLLDVEATEYYCLPCLAEFLDCERRDLEDKLQEFKEQGCTLFLGH